MKPLSPRAAELVNDLRCSPTFMERLSGRADTDETLLEELQRDAEPAVVPHLLPFLFSASRSVAIAAAGVATLAFERASAEELIELDQSGRRLSSYNAPWEEGWASLAPLQLSRFTAFGDSEVGVLGVASFHANGYVREAAVTRLAALESELALALLLLRLNDWVDPVASAARDAVQHRLAPRYAAAFMDQLPLLERLGVSRRRDHGPLIGRIRALLAQPEQRDVLRRGMESPDRRVRRHCFRLAWSDWADAGDELLRRALADPDPGVRVASVAEERRLRRTADLDSLLPVMLADPYPAVRREALALAVEQVSANADAFLRSSLLDRNQVVREVARFFLRRREGLTAFADIYRSYLAPDTPIPTLAAALAGLGETSTAVDAPAVLPYTVHPRTTVRRAAIRALGLLDGDGHAEHLLHALHDPSGSVSATARDQLRRRASGLQHAVAGAYRAGALPHARRHAFTLLSSLGKWERLPYLLEAAADPDLDLRRIAAERLDVWIATQNRTFSPPTPLQLRAIRLAYDAHHVAVERRVTDEVRAILRFWSE